MTASFSLNKEDFLTNLLFFSSKSKRIKKIRLIGWILFSIGCFMWAYVFYLERAPIPEIMFIIFGIIVAIFYPRYQARAYRKRFAKHLEETKKACFDEVCKVEISTESIMATDNGSETKIKTAELTEIIEIGNYFFLKTKYGTSVILPKSAFDVDALELVLETISRQYKILFTKELAWKWS